DNLTVHNHTFRVVQQNNLTWTEALQLCQSLNMELASLKFLGENNHSGLDSSVKT
ncbi:hypothetical protein M9458_023884, partial [Cirrhinus mrigala]